MPEERVQCLLFVVDQKPSGVRKSRRGQAHSSIKGYAILPQAFIDANPHIFDSFLHNDFQVIVNDGEDTPLQPSLEISKLEMFETQILLDDPENEVETLNSSRPHFMLVDPFNREVIQLLLRSEFEIRTLNEDENTGFMSAVTDNLKALEFLSTADPDITYNHFKGGTVMHFAVKRSEENLVKLLVKCGADLKAVRHDALMPLHLAVKKLHLEIVKVLVQNGADVNSSVECDQEGRTPLVIAYESKYRDDGDEGEKKMINIIKFLLESGANVDLEFSYNLIFDLFDYRDHVTRTTILYLAALNGSTEKNLLDIILNHNPSPDNEYNKKAFRYMLFAIEDELIDPFNRMLKIGFGINLEEVESSVDFLCGAIHKNYYELVESTVRRGTRVTEICERRSRLLGKFTPLHMAAAYAGEDIINFLLAQGADVNAKSTTLYETHKTPLQWAVLHGNKTSIRILMDRKASFCNEIDDLFENAAVHGLLDLVEFFLLRGENVRYSNAIFRAARGGHIKVIKTLIEYGAEFGTELFSCSTLGIAYASGHKEVFQTLLNHNFGNRKVLFSFHNYTILYHCRRPDADDEFYAEKLYCLTALARHIIKMEAESLPFFDQDLTPIWSGEDSIDDFRTHCLSEIASLREKTVNNSGLTFHHILMGNLNQLVGYARNETVVNYFRQANHNNMFPIYADVINCQFEKGKQRWELMKKGIEICKKLFQPEEEFSFKKLPDELKEKIIGYMNNRDLKRLDAAWSQRKSHQQTEIPVSPTVL